MGANRNDTEVEQRHPLGIIHSVEAASGLTHVQKPAYFVRVDEAAEITGLAASLIRKSFIAEAKRPRNVPPPPPHIRIGRAVYIICDQLPAWLASLGEGTCRSVPVRPKRKEAAAERSANNDSAQGFLPFVQRSSGKPRP
jgi:hypothetical protein